MSENEKRGWPAFDRTVGASSGAAFGVLAALYLGPEAGNVLGAAAGPLFEELSHSMRQLAARKFARVEQAAEEASREGQCEFAELVRRSLEDDHRAALMGAALHAAADAADDQKVRALGRAYARGVLTSDDAKVDEQLRIVTTLAALEPVDVRVVHRMTSHAGWTIRPLESNPYFPTLVNEDPGVSPIIDAVVARLSTLGLISDASSGGVNWDGSGTQWHVTEFGRVCLGALREAGQSEQNDE
jgi:hypothetical protein